MSARWSDSIAGESPYPLHVVPPGRPSLTLAGGVIRQCVSLLALVLVVLACPLLMPVRRPGPIARESLPYYL
jgi:hypothetical protein